MTEIELPPTAVYAECWRRGELSWKLLPHEMDLYRFMREDSAFLSIAHCARGFGKTKTLLILAMEYCLRAPDTRVYYIAPKQSQAKQILLPVLAWLSSDAPDALRPKWHFTESGILFANGSLICVYGTDGKQYDNARGQTIKTLAIIDEAGFCDDLDIMVRDVLDPACRKGGGRIVMVSTSPESTEHPFRDMAEEAKARGRYIRKTIDDNLGWGEKEKAAAVSACRGVATATYRREYLCEFVMDERSAVIPEWTDAVEAECVRDMERPDYYYSCGALDPGTKDHTGYVCGYYDFKAGLYVVTGEYFANGVTTVDIVGGMRFAEGDLRIDRRVSDTSLQVILDLRRLHCVDIQPVTKDHLEAMVNFLRMAVGEKRVVVLPSCPVTARQMRTAQWERNRDMWKRTELNGHFDCLAALIYWMRSIDTASNPWPAIPKGLKWQDYFDRHNRKPGEVRDGDGWEKLAEVL